MSTINMVSQRDYVLRTKMGHTIDFKANVPTPVAEQAYAEALAVNIVPVERPDGDTPQGRVEAAITGTLRDALIYKAIASLVARNNYEDFTGGGVPKAAAVSVETAFSVSQNEVSRYWGNYRSMVATNEALPTHPHMAQVEELQTCTTRKALEEFCSDHDINVKGAKGKTVKELKEQVMHAVVAGQAVPPAADEYVKPETLTKD